jgi:CheY-like chemotaxis protein
MTQVRPSILLIDDQPDTVSHLKTICEPSVELKIVEPSAATYADLAGSHLVLVDFVLEDWNSRTATSELALQPMDGLALAEILKSHLRSKKAPTPIAFAVLSGELSRLTDPFPAHSREHMVAQTTNLEWAFQKGKPNKTIAKQFVSLATAVTQLPKAWPHDSLKDLHDLLQKLLSIPSEAFWKETAISDLLKCHPPVRELSTWSHGLAFIRWLLHTILPYPCFLMDARQVAVRLRITYQSFLAALEESDPLVEQLKSSLYSGILSEFDGPRWWKAGVDAFVWKLTEEEPFSTNVLAKQISDMSPNVMLVTIPNPVIRIDAEYQPVDEFIDASECVRLVPDDWPPFAEQAWAKRSDVTQDDRLAMIVMDEDRGLLRDRIE